VASPETLIDAGVSEREAEVLELVAQRATNAEIAARLFVSVRTVESHVSSLLRKLEVADRRALAQVFHERDEREAGVPPAAPSVGHLRHRDPESAAAPAPGSAGLDTTAEDGADGRRPAPRPTLARAVPVPLTSFVGRAAEVAELTAAVETHRLVTATGPGGMGKTRLAAEVAAALAGDRRDGVWFVDLVPVIDGELVATAVANTLGLGDPQGRSVENAVVAHLAEREALLVLDNCEHVADAVAVFVERVLGSCPEVSVLATSQARLMLPFEWVFPVSGLSLPTASGVEGDDDADPACGDAVTLFVERARQAGAGDLTNDDPRRIGEICRRLDGSALAIELAAARLPSLGLDGIERGLSERFRLLSGGSRVDERHRSLRSAIDWSYDLLAPADQALLRRVAVFASPFTADAATVVAGFAPVEPTAVADGLARLAEHSLLVTSSAVSETRYRPLESIRQYGVAQMGSDAAEHDETRRRHLAWAADIVADLDRRADLPLSAVLARADDLAVWRQDFDRAADDTRAALKWAMHRPDLRPQAFGVARLLAATCFTRGLLGESQHRYEQAAEVAADTATRIEMLMCAGGAASSRQAGGDSLRLWRAAADTAGAAGDTGAAARALAASAELLLRGPGIIADKPPEGTHTALIDEARALGATDPRAEAALLTAVTFEMEETHPDAAATAERAVAAARALDDPLLESAALDALTVVHLGRGNVAGALDAVRRRIELLSGLRPSARSAFEIADAYNMAVEVSVTAGDFTAARAFADTLARLPFHSVDRHLATNRRMRVEALAGELDRVLADGELFRRGWERAGRPVSTSLASGAYAVAMTHGLRGDDVARAEWLRITIDLGLDRDRLEGCYTGYGPTFDAIVALHRGDAQAAFDRLEHDPGDFDTWYTGEWRPWYAAFHAEAAVLLGHESAAERIERARPMVAANPMTVALVERAAALLAGDTDRLVELASELAATGCRYQWARTLVLAGEPHAAEGRRAMADLGAAPMA
jgi:predicted ATPase/DNA-binding CsgD family transcriptional regulator